MAGKQSRQERVAELIAGVREAATGAVERSSAIGLPTIDPSVYDGIISPAELQERQADPGSVVETVGEPGPEYRYGGLPDGELLTLRMAGKARDCLLQQHGVDRVDRQLVPAAVG